jgi:formate-dependent nitrite reductase membrane component NrfD
MKLPHLLVAAFAAGCAALLVLAPGWSGTGSPLLPLTGDIVTYDERGTAAAVLAPRLMVALVLHALLVIAELSTRHPSGDAALAAALLRRGAFAGRLWGGVLGAGVVAPLVLLFVAAGTESAALTVVAALLALAGLWLYEDVWVKAGQSIPLS